MNLPQTTVETYNNSDIDNHGYVGMSWSLGGSYVPTVVLGLVRAKVNSDGHTTGADLSLSFDLSNGLQPAVAKLSYLNGNEEAQGELGAGYNFIKAAPLLGIGVNAPYSAVGVDLYQDSAIVPFGTLKTLGEFDKPKETVVITNPVI